MLYVCDYSNHRISVFRASDGTYVRCFGGQPHLQTPVGIAFGLDGEIYVTQYEVHRVAVFHANEGTFSRSFPAVLGHRDETCASWVTFFFVVKIHVSRETAVGFPNDKQRPMVQPTVPRHDSVLMPRAPHALGCEML